ncbi:hypothetical protein [Agrobacterium tumefaciens]|uniref:hypothetical protein n=1 Tax=Agrobacterium tumefaciens TaxID=358 RepID=UPI001574D242|nr:hypothetical protein [Agrobacterium tumefaciens]NSX90088.1 hypothetical protein [Agrobacterium tumefaciens]
MTALEETKKALAAAEQFIVNGVELGYIHMPNPETPDSAHDTLPMIRQAQAALETLQRENEELRNLTADLRLQAQTHAIEARGANATINEIYQIISGGKGEPGNWNGAEPVRKFVAQMQAALLPFSKAAEIKLCGEWHDDERFAQTDVGFHLTFGDLRRARTALTSTGGEHHADK